jgi:CRISPR-associated protein Csb1
MFDFSKFSADCLSESGPMALHIKTPLRSVMDKQSPIFPSTTAPAKDSDGKGKYSISEMKDGKLCCDIDSVGSQANRMEGMFKDQYPQLVPQVTVVVPTITNFGGIQMQSTITVNLLDIGHRVGDGFLRCTDLCETVISAIEQYKIGDALPMAKFAPTSLVFGFWDSRGIRIRCERVVQGTIRAYDVAVAQRSAQFFPIGDASDFDVAHILSELGLEKEKKGTLQNAGLIDAVGNNLGGVFVYGDIFREVIVYINIIRRLRSSDGRNEDLQRYILSLALLSALGNYSPHLRQGCMLVPDLDKQKVSELYYRDGKHEPFFIPLKDIEDACVGTAAAFGVGPNMTGSLNKVAARTWVNSVKKNA